MFEGQAPPSRVEAPRGWGPSRGFFPSPRPLRQAGPSFQSDRRVCGRSGRVFSGRLSDASVCLLEFWRRVCGVLLLQPPRVRRGPTRSVANPIASPSSSSTLLELSASPLRVQAAMRKIGFLQARRQALLEWGGGAFPVSGRCRAWTLPYAKSWSCAGAHLRRQGHGHVQVHI